MRQTTLTHSDDQIRLVAAGLVVLTTTDVAAEQLRRVYGEERAGQALAPLAARTAPRPVEVTLDPCPSPAVGWAAPRALGAAPRALGAGRRGTRRTDWL